MKYYLPAALMLVSSLAACDHSNDIGMSIIEDDTEIVTDSLFTVTAKCIPADKIQSRTITQLLGSIDARGYGEIYSDFVTQFMPASSIDTTDVKIDRLKLILSMSKSSSGFIGDSIVPMGLEVYELTEGLPYPIYNTFGADVANYYDASSPIANKIYTFATKGESDSIQALSYVEIPIEMPNSLRDKLWNVYKKNPSVYLQPTQFAKEFPGLYVRSSYGDGRIVRIGNTVMNLEYHKDAKTDEGKDTTYYYTSTYYAVSPEIITNNNISYKMSDVLRARIDAGENVIVAPIGTDVEYSFPINDIARSYRQGAGKLSVINSVSFTLPVDTIANDYEIGLPIYVLMVQKNKKAEFFANNLLPDGETSFLGTLNKTTLEYEFPDMRTYLANILKDGDATADESLYVLTPVSVTMEDSGNNYYYGASATQVLSAVTPYVETPVMARLKFDEAKIKLNYSKQSVIN